MAVDLGVELSDLTHAAALLVGVVVGIVLTLRVVRAVVELLKRDDE